MRATTGLPVAGSLIIPLKFHIFCPLRHSGKAVNENDFSKSNCKLKNYKRKSHFKIMIIWRILGSMFYSICSLLQLYAFLYISFYIAFLFTLSRAWYVERDIHSYREWEFSSLLRITTHSTFMVRPCFNNWISKLCWQFHLKQL